MLIFLSDDKDWRSVVAAAAAAAAAAVIDVGFDRVEDDDGEVRLVAAAAAANDDDDDNDFAATDLDATFVGPAAPHASTPPAPAENAEEGTLN